MPSTIGIVAGGYFSAFTPADLSPDAWFDASDASTITSSGGSVSQWNNKGSLGNLTQATSSSQPGTGAVTQNGKNVLTFDGGDWLAASTASPWKFMHDGTDYIVAAAVQWGTSSNPDALYALFGTFESSFFQTGSWAGYDDRSSVPRNNWIRHIVCNSSGTPVVSNNSSDNSTTPNVFTVFTIRSNPDDSTASARSSIFNNSGSAISNNTNTASVSSSNPQMPLSIGVLPNPSTGFQLAYLVGRIGEIVIVSGANATEANRVKLRDYLNTKWAVY